MHLQAVPVCVVLGILKTSVLMVGYGVLMALAHRP